MTSPPTSKMVDVHTQIPAVPSDGNDADAVRASIIRHLAFTLAELPEHVDTLWEPYVSLALAVRDRLNDNWIKTQESSYRHDAKRVY